jgi:hypothetical protein
VKFALTDIRKWKSGLSCSPTALAAITGKTPDEIAVLLKEAARINGRDISVELLPGYDINDWLKVIKLLGGDWVQAETHEEKEFTQRPTINEWMANSMGADLELVFCDDGQDIGHVFATLDGHVVDTYTGGKRIPFDKVPADYEMLRVKHAFLVFISPAEMPASV